jgi:phosphoribosylglycinamide formyltransferase 1
VSASAERDAGERPADQTDMASARRLRLVVLASGRGSNLAALMSATRSGRLHAELLAVFSDRANAGALEIAAAAAVAGRWINPKAFDSRLAFDHALFAEIDALTPDLIICAGFMRILSAEVVAAQSQRMINIHPSLLPKYPGLHTHQRALDAGDSEHGASVHFVIPALDAGPVIAQTRIPIHHGDDAATLATRLLPAEHELLVRCVGKFNQHRIGHGHGQLLVDGQARPAWQYR